MVKKTQTKIATLAMITQRRQTYASHVDLGAARHRKTPGRPIQARVRVRDLCDGGPQSWISIHSQFLYVNFDAINSEGKSSA